VFRISGITKTSADATYIPQEDGSRGPTVAAYFSERYKALQYPSMPCVRIGPLAKHNYLPVCNTSIVLLRSTTAIFTTVTVVASATDMKLLLQLVY
jgi:hypothetical protein